ncbi:(E)-4-hydroxy-3-methylbut-2-enyl-diphosphate synthase [Candidatus Marinimicrobia bacterium]|nr:(E)-4-hydroxy-3-methylbut-2-enyl-diphosphate synthase [Candidatus Neomarinimicrobiota bacterium]
MKNNRLRFFTREVRIGNLPMGGNNPIRIQSMTTTSTLDTDATVEQSIRMIKAGCEYIRITAPNKRQAENLQNIKDSLRSKGYNTPIIADIHFTPSAAEVAANIVEKVRINPGNYADRKNFKIREYSDLEYKIEIDRIEEKFSPLVSICKKNDTAMRIGTNHGSLSDRIMNRYGDTPLGMVESALEFARICEAHNFNNLVFSMKASNPIVVVQAYRLLVKNMIKENMNYPLHLGVTEAGDGEDGRIKSALGIGTLLEEGIGDTIRVSLTEPPENEIPIAKILVNRYSHYKNNKNNSSYQKITDYKQRKTHSASNIGGKNVPRVIINLQSIKNISRKTLEYIGYTYFEKDDKWGIKDLACDYINIGHNNIDFNIPGTLSIIQKYSIWKENKKERHYPELNYKEYLSQKKIDSKVIFLSISLDKINKKLISEVINNKNTVLIVNILNFSINEQKLFFNILLKENFTIPVVLFKSYKSLNIEELQLYSSIDIGALLIEGFGDGISIILEKEKLFSEINRTSFGILQATRTRISKTEYISCPSCGRTLFDLEETTAMIRSKTSHLKGLKIGIMGCIVNGPGEMADADYGYVGTGIDKISLYRGQKIIKSNLHPDIATEELINLIKSDGNWIEPK